MNSAAQRENARSLAEMLGASEEEAGKLLNVAAAITVQPNDLVAMAIAESVKEMLARTLTDVAINRPSSDVVSVEVVVGAAEPRHIAGRAYVAIDGSRMFVSSSRKQHSPGLVLPVSLLIASCYACALALKVVIGERLPYPVPDTFVVDLDSMLGADVSLLKEEIDFGEIFLAGAGAIGNGFILGLSKLLAKGTVHVLDDDVVSTGNLQRCLLFSEADIGNPKAHTLSRAAEKLMPRITFLPQKRLLQYASQKVPGPWLRRLVVGVDSPRVRRALQTEIPGEVFDASTTGAAEIVFHFHRQPTEGACMACVYKQSPQENARELHIAESLGVSVSDVRELRVSEQSARKICMRYPNLKYDEVIGAAYDTLFKAQCSSNKLFTTEGRQVLTPFAFISVLAGTMLALEFIRRVHRGHAGLYNEWRISPWTNPVTRRKQQLGRDPNCSFCADPLLRVLADELWSSVSAPSQ